MNLPASFAALGLIDPLLRALAEQGYARPTPIQSQAIPAVIDGRDLLAAAQTGSGKTAAFALPLLQRLIADTRTVAPHAPRALVLVPTRELADQVAASFRTYGAHLPLAAIALYGGVPMAPQIAALAAGVDVAVATPGRLLDLLRQGAIELSAARHLVLDEADRMLALGFARELDEIFTALPRRRQTLLFSATYAEPVRDMARRILRQPLSLDGGARNAAAQGVSQWLITVDKKRKPELLLHLIRSRRWRQALVFVKTRKGADQLVARLVAQGLRAEAIHGERAQPERLRLLARFVAGESDFLVATDVAARGLDIDDLPLVVNLDLPIVAEDYIHRIGRTGRAGARGEAVSLVCADEVELLAAIERLLGRGLPRHEVAGFEADHRVPATRPSAPASGSPAGAAKGRGNSKRPAGSGAGGGANPAAPRRPAAGGRATPRPASAPPARRTRTRR